MKAVGSKVRRRWYYSGPVYRFEKEVKRDTYITVAPTKAKAIVNICFRAKKELGLEPNTKVSILVKNIREI